VRKFHYPIQLTFYVQWAFPDHGRSLKFSIEDSEDIRLVNSCS
jgi:hypothetical protein